MDYFRGRKLAHTLFAYSGGLAYGICEMSRSINFPLFKEAYQLSYGEQGTMLTTTQWLYIAMTVLGTILLPYLRYKWSCIIGFALALVGSLVVAIFDKMWPVMIGFHILYMGYGLVDIGLNCFLAAFFTHNTGLMMNVFHGIYGVGAIIGPLIAGNTTHLTSMGFRFFYIISSVILVLEIIYAGLLDLDSFYEPPDPASPSPQTPSRSKAKYGILTAVRDPLIYLAILALGLQTNVEMAASSWAVLYIKDVLHLDAERDGSTFMTVFYVFFTASRLLLGGLFEKIGFLTSLQVSTLGGCVFFLVGFVTGNIGQYFLMVTGGFVAIFWPCMMCVLMEIYGPDAPRATSYVIGVHNIFGSLLSLGQGYLNEYTGPAWGYRTAIPLSVLASLVVFSISWVQHRRRRRLTVLARYKPTVLLQGFPEVVESMKTELAEEEKIRRSHPAKELESRSRAGSERRSRAGTQERGVSWDGHREGTVVIISEADILAQTREGPATPPCADNSGDALLALASPRQ